MRMTEGGRIITLDEDIIRIFRLHRWEIKSINLSINKQWNIKAEYMWKEKRT